VTVKLELAPVGGILGGVTAAQSALADATYPTRAIRVVSPFPPGSAKSNHINILP
jgi:tripartite-type tricarboxylate transporter receptor subunit TctC